MKKRIATAARPARVVFRKEIGAAVNDAVGPTQAGVEAELAHIRRVLQDDMDAANEVTTVFGRLLSQLSDRLDGIEATLAGITARLDTLSQPPAKMSPSAQPGRRKGTGGGERTAADPAGAGAHEVTPQPS